jgi:hypothetical protein
MDILLHLIEHGNITTIEAFSKYKITRAAEYIRQLRSEGKQIISKWVTGRSGKRYVEYSLERAS